MADRPKPAAHECFLCPRKTTAAVLLLPADLGLSLGAPPGQWRGFRFPLCRRCRRRPDARRRVRAKIDAALAAAAEGD
jgi:hypothetical protein